MDARLAVPTVDVRKSIPLNVLFGLDVIVYTPRNLAQRVAWGDSFLQEILAQGVVLYESTAS